MARIVARPYKYQRNPDIARLSRIERRIDPYTGFPVLRQNAIQLQNGQWIDRRYNYVDINPRTGGPIE